MSKPDPTNPLLHELDSLKGLLDADTDRGIGGLPAARRRVAADPVATGIDIPILDEVVEPDSPPTRREIEALVDAMLVRALAHLRRELRERLLAEVLARLDQGTAPAARKPPHQV